MFNITARVEGQRENIQDYTCSDGRRGAFGNISKHIWIYPKRQPQDYIIVGSAAPCYRDCHISTAAARAVLAVAENVLFTKCAQPIISDLVSIYLRSLQ